MYITYLGNTNKNFLVKTLAPFVSSVNWHTRRLNYISNLFSVLLKLYKHNYSECVCNYLIYNTLKMHTYTNFSVKKSLTLLFSLLWINKSYLSIFSCTNTMIQNIRSELCEITWSILPWKCIQTSNFKPHKKFGPIVFYCELTRLYLYFQLYKHDDPECSELCECNLGEVLSCKVLECIERDACNTGVAFYSHASPFYQAYRGQCLCYSGSFVCSKPPKGNSSSKQLSH